MRKLASIRQIKDINPIPKADAIEAVTIDGWTCVSKKGEFQPGDWCVYFEVDSFLPADDPRFEFLKKSGVKKEPSGRERIRLKTVKLRGQLSQGLALPIDLFEELKLCQLGEDVSNLLDVIKYERPEPKVANAAGHRPDVIKKTDEERIQNVYDDYKDQFKDTEYYATLKLDGSSCTVAFLAKDMDQVWSYEAGVPEDEQDNWKAMPVTHRDKGKIGEKIVCSRNMQLKNDPDSHFWKAVKNSAIFSTILYIAKQEWNCEKSFAIQGEVMGPGIQGNKEKLNDYRFFCFSIFDISNQEYLSYDECRKIFDRYQLEQVPLITQNTIKPFTLFDDLDSILEYADGQSINAKYREVIVFKPAYDRSAPSFKVISNKFFDEGRG